MKRTFAEAMAHRRSYFFIQHRRIAADRVITTAMRHGFCKCSLHFSFFITADKGKKENPNNLTLLFVSLYSGYKINKRKLN